MNANSLDLADCDDVDLIENIEESFGIKFSEDRLFECYTVGDLHDAALAEFDVPKTGRPICFAAVAFYRLRRALQKHCPGLVVRPDTSLRDVPAGTDVEQLRDTIWEETGLGLPRLCMHPLAYALAWLTISAPLWLSLLTDKLDLHWIMYLMSIALAAGGIALIKLNPGGRPSDMTFGDQAKCEVALKLGAYAREYNWWRERDIWDALLHHCRLITGTQIEITRDTRLMA